MRLHLFFTATLLLVSCGGGNDGRIRTIEPLTLSGQINNYSGGTKYIASGLDSQLFDGEISNSGQFSITIPANTPSYPKTIFDVGNCKNPNYTSTNTPINFVSIPVFLSMSPSKNSESEGYLYQSTCDTNGGCTLPTRNFTLQHVYVPQPVSIKNFTCTAPYYLTTTYNINIDLVPGWNTIRFTQINVTATTETFDVENNDNTSPNWNVKKQTFGLPASQHP